MKLKGIKSIFLFFLIFSVINLNLFSEEVKKIDFYGVYSQDADKNMLNMTEDLFYTQLRELSIDLTDKRQQQFSQGEESFNPLTYDFLITSDKNSYALFVQIKKLPTLKWECSIFLKKLSSEKTYSTTKEYDSYYKILMESKTNLKGMLIDLLDSTKNLAIASETEEITSDQIISTDVIAGSWKGENFIDKIVIMRGGRGFIIYKNGASMNILINISKNEENGSPTININQASRNNASYYPELQRKDAMEYAIDAQPIEWSFKLANAKTLKGTKSTLVQKMPGVAPEQGIIDVEWTKVE